MSLTNHLFGSFVKMLGEGKDVETIGKKMRFGDFPENFMILISIRGKKSTAHILYLGLWNAIGIFSALDLSVPWMTSSIGLASTPSPHIKCSF